jgi:hypothetical protein
MKIKEVLLKLQSPGRGSSYQDEKMLEDFIYDEVAKKTKELTAKLNAALGEISALKTINHKLSDQLSALKKNKPL